MADRTIDSPTTNPRRILGLFGKAWDAGKVKTRLAKTLGDEVAAEIYQSLLTLNLMRFGHSGDQRVVAYSPSDQETERRFESFLLNLKPRPQWELVPQSDGGLGVRMSRFFQQQFDHHAEGVRVVLIGSDALWLMRDMMDEAFELLQSNDVVFGPSTDGGYYLVGMSVMSPQIFEDIDWSTERVLAQSLERCESLGLKVAQLSPLTDIDNEEDLRKEVRSLRGVDDIELEAMHQCFRGDIDDILGKDWP